MKASGQCQHKAFLPLREGGRKGVFFISSFLSVSFLVLPLSQNNSVSLGLHCVLPVTLRVPQPCPRLRCSLKGPLSTSTMEAIQATERSEKLPDEGGGKPRGTEGYSSAWPGCSFNEKVNRLSPGGTSSPTGKKMWPLVLLSLNYLCSGTTRRPCSPLDQSIAGSLRSVTFSEYVEVTRIQLYFRCCCLLLPVHTVPLQVISFMKGA